MTKDGISEILAILATTYGVRFTDHEVRIWHELLEPITDEDGRRATVVLCRTSVYRPKPADIMLAVLGDPRDAERLLTEEAEAALVHLEREFADYETVDYGPAINAAIAALGGPDTVGRLMVREEWKFHRDEFRTLYKVYRRRGDGAAPPVPHNVAESAGRGYPLPAPRSALFLPTTIPGLPAPTPHPVLPAEVSR